MRLIDADALIDWLTKPTGFKTNCDDCTCTDCLDCVTEEAIKNAPTIEAKIVVHAHWEETGMVLGKCSNCGGICPKIEYCGRCGAQMDEVVKDG